ncbi:hypothetical protein COV16_01495 [Candidatus Woesearchaeota archaeon CG10_big_fil_rev_8_21_14_0_10_34_8]|nr:MAG: hypothetical protein COV16_01495 [Candidatus Woesearchaeota archaeon CG10_big_fil_rev_8_21_14_0_10_34_8]
MAKRRREKKSERFRKDQTSMYLLAIVGIVAFVGIVVLVLNAGSSDYTSSEDEAVYDEDGDLTGMMYRATVRKLTKETSGGSCTSHSDCRSGHCNSNGRCA